MESGHQAIKSLTEPIFDDAKQSLDTIFPGDFFSFLIGSPTVGDGNLIDANAKPTELGNDLWLDAEAFLLDLEALEQLGFEHFVAALHVREVKIGGHV